MKASAKKGFLEILTPACNNYYNITSENNPAILNTFNKLTIMEHLPITSSPTLAKTAAVSHQISSINGPKAVNLQTDQHAYTQFYIVLSWQ